MTDGRFGRTAREQALFEQARQVALAHRAAQASRNGSGLGPADARSSARCRRPATSPRRCRARRAGTASRRRSSPRSSRAWRPS